MRAPTLARGPLGAALALRAGRRALKPCYGLTDCSGGEFDLGAERRALPQFVHGFGNLRVRPTVGQHHAPPNLPGFPGSLTPACPVEMVYMVFYIAFTCESKCRVALSLSRKRSRRGWLVAAVASGLIRIMSRNAPKNGCGRGGFAPPRLSCLRVTLRGLGGLGVTPRGG